MKASVRESLKTGLVFAAVGVVIGLTVPALLTLGTAAMGLTATGLGATTAVAVLGSAVIFGGLGVLSPYLHSFFGLSSGKESPEMMGPVAAKGGSDSRQINVSAQGPALQTAETAEATFRQKLEADRMAGRAADRLSI